MAAILTVAEEKLLLSIAVMNKPYHLHRNKLTGTMIQLEDYLELKSSSFLLNREGKHR